MLIDCVSPKLDLSVQLNNYIVYRLMTKSGRQVLDCCRAHLSPSLPAAQAGEGDRR